MNAGKPSSAVPASPPGARRLLRPACAAGLTVVLVGLAALCDPAGGPVRTDAAVPPPPPPKNVDTKPSPKTDMPGSTGSSSSGSSSSSSGKTPHHEPDSKLPHHEPDSKLPPGKPGDPKTPAPDAKPADPKGTAKTPPPPPGPGNNGKIVFNVAGNGNRLPHRPGDVHFRIESRPVARVTAEMTWDFNAPHATTKEWVVTVPKPPETPGQTDVSAGTRPAGNTVTETAGLRRPMITARETVKPGDDVGRKLFRMSATYAATLHARALVPLGDGEAPPKVAPLPAADVRLYTAATPTLDFETAVFKRWIADNGLEKAAAEDPLVYARRVFDHLRTTRRYAAPKGLERKASVLAGLDHAECGGIAALFTATMRAAKIPGRMLVGRYARTAIEQGYQEEHVRAEFWLPGVGWVPVDPCAGLSRFVRTSAKGEPVDPKAVAAVAATADPRDVRLSDAFGREAGDLLVMHVDPDFVVQPNPRTRVTTPCFHFPSLLSVGGGSSKDAAGTLGWTVKSEPPPAPAAAK